MLYIKAESYWSFMLKQVRKWTSLDIHMCIGMWKYIYTEWTHKRTIGRTDKTVHNPLTTDRVRWSHRTSWLISHGDHNLCSIPSSSSSLVWLEPRNRMYRWTYRQTNWPNGRTQGVQAHCSNAGRASMIKSNCWLYNLTCEARVTVPDRSKWGVRLW